MLDIIWDQTYSVNIAEIDLQHQKIAVLLDVLFEAVEQNRSVSILAEIIQELIAYAEYHFETEENLMRRYQFPEYIEHKKEHDDFRKKVLQFQEDLHKKKETLASDLIKLMTHWLSDHVMNLDKKYGPFLNAKGVF
ncbi:MAG TPA: bacteriohemerythrin [Candidatus Omnitrophota bacterium]|nr:bacteriohemerythrin [Candidatus Omnitrophota bacterium]